VADHWIGWMGVANVAEPAYKEPIVEFLSSFSLVHPSDDEPHYSVRYRLYNQEHQLSLATFNVALGFKIEESIQTEEYRTGFCDYLDDFHDGVFWHQITGDHPYELRVAKSTTMDSALCILHQWLIIGLYGRKDSTGNVFRHHFFIL